MRTSSATSRLLAIVIVSILQSDLFDTHKRRRCQALRSKAAIIIGAGSCVLDRIPNRRNFEDSNVQRLLDFLARGCEFGAIHAAGRYGVCEFVDRRQLALVDQHGGLICAQRPCTGCMASITASFSQRPLASLRFIVLRSQIRRGGAAIAGGLFRGAGEVSTTRPLPTRRRLC